MNNRPFLILSLTAAVFASADAVAAQTPTQTYTRPRVVSLAHQTQSPAATAATPAASPTVAPSTTAQSSSNAQPTSPASPSSTSQPSTVSQSSPFATSSSQVVVPYKPLLPARPLSMGKFREHVAEAQRLLKSRLTLTSMTPNTAFVTIAALEQDTAKIHTLSVPKDTFLTPGADVVLTTAQGLNVRLQVVRPNYVNTAVVVSEAATGKQLTPLVVEYPIEKLGRFREMAYYTSAHPALLSPEVVKHGRDYVHTMLDLAAQRLKERGVVVSPEIVDIAERLCVVEHIDHDRFRREGRPALFNEIYSLYALNELDTFRYSVSSAGAGGMVQMIAPTYVVIRNAHPSVGLNPDFVAGMRNHGNALEAMLLYMQDTWNSLALNQDVLDALASKNATQAEIIAAGYNSNPAHLPQYLKRGGPGWRTLVPRETQMYLQIYQSLEGLVDFKNRGSSKSQPQPATVSGATQPR
ncbi:MAG TPA: hypothetical protein VFA21_10060 [Pyrinomonadaceae bacterium]|nr:hypothetical protein [Pyrinomonadaceae bacterium]